MIAWILAHRYVVLQGTILALCVWLVLRTHRQAIADMRYQIDYTEDRLKRWKHRARLAVAMLSVEQREALERECDRMDPDRAGTGA